MNCKYFQQWISDGAEPTPTITAHLETCSACRTVVERELADEPLPLRNLPLLELPMACQNAPELPGNNPADREQTANEAPTAGWSWWLVSAFRSWMPAPGILVLLLGFGSLLAGRFLQPEVTGRQPCSIDVAALPRLAAAAAEAAGPALPEPVFVRRNWRNETIVFANLDSYYGGKSDDTDTNTNTYRDTMSGSITFVNEPTPTVNFVMEERVLTFYDLNFDEEEANNG